MVTENPGLRIETADGKITVQDGASNFLKALADGAGFLFGNPMSAFTGTKSLIDFARGIKFEDSPGRDSYRAILLAFAWSFDQLSQDDVSGSVDRKAYIRQLVDVAKNEVDQGLHFIDESFLREPTRNSLYQKLRGYVVTNIRNIIPGVAHPARSIERRLDANFDRGIAEVFIQRPELFKSIQAVVDFLQTSPSLIHRDWSHLHSLWRFDFRSTILFGQEQSGISTSEMYVPLRAKPYRAHVSPIDMPDDDDELSPYNRVFYLVDEIAAWIEAGEGQVLLVGGGPGSGKSTSLRALVDQLTDDERHRVIYLPLQRLSLESDLKGEIDRIIGERTGAFREFTVLSRESLATASNLILVFDGLDEIAKPGDKADQIAQQFVLKLNLLISLLQSREGCPRIKCIVSGRIPAFQAAKRYLDVADENCYEVLGFRPINLSDTATDVERLDQRREWWTLYSQLFGAQEQPVPIFLSPAWAEITNEPLLCYLLALSGHLDPSTSHEFVNTNQIFASLVDQVWVRGWAAAEGNRRVSPNRQLTQQDFNDLMEAFALAAWHGGDTRSASEDGFDRTVQTIRRQDTWQRFKQDNGEDVTNLAMNFYFRSSDENARGFEFTHKSFGDYLAARCLFKLALEVTDYSNRKLDLAISDWFNIASRCSFSLEIFNFLANEVQLFALKKSNIASLKALLGRFEAIAAHVAAEGFDIGYARNSSELYTWHRQAELSAHAMRAVTFHALRLATGEIAQFTLPRELGIDFPSVIFRLVKPNAAVSGFPETKFFPGISSPGANFFGLCLANADFSYSNLRDCNFSWGFLNTCDLSHCDLSDSRFLRSNLLECDFEGSNLANTFFDYATIERTDLISGTKGKISVNSVTLAWIDDDTLLRLRKSKRARSRLVPRVWEHSAGTADEIMDRLRLLSEIENGPNKVARVGTRRRKTGK